MSVSVVGFIKVQGQEERLPSTNDQFRFKTFVGVTRVRSFDCTIELFGVMLFRVKFDVQVYVSEIKVIFCFLAACPFMFSTFGCNDKYKPIITFLYLNNLKMIRIFHVSNTEYPSFEDLVIIFVQYLNSTSSYSASLSLLLSSKICTLFLYTLF